ncbi:hypothetical protein LCGC14_0548650 [marine sediment metagenome]|uniref:Uncharacterized protein n=1 Tax=marine sediment metagenome TaxID=412755 RepID=A0A0F9RQP2_9ZZZZ
MVEVTKDPEIYSMLIKGFVRQLRQAEYLVETLAICGIISDYVEKWALAMKLKSEMGLTETK